MSNIGFTKKKFQSLSLQSQHKKCAELLRSIYSPLLQGNTDFSLLKEYSQLAKWLYITEELPLTEDAVSNRYHYHLRLADQKLKEHSLLPRIRKQDRDSPLAPPLPITVYLDNLRSAHNVGSIIRTTEALSLGSLYFSAQTPYINCKQVADAAMGAQNWLNCIPNACLDNLPKPLIALETSDDAVSLDNFLFPEAFTLILGNEEYGCSPVSLKQADFLIEISLYGRKNSLNVANAFAIAAYTIRQQADSKNFSS